MSLPSSNQPFVTGSVFTAIGEVPRVSSFLNEADRWGAIRVRCGLGRKHYRVEPGLYALGTPDPQTPVLVTANYKLSFDHLRQALEGRAAWILVLDTEGVNVWCAAGKGSFGTTELVRRIETSGLARVVTHRNLIVPQLGAPGVSAGQVKKLSPFRVTFGPIRARDLPAFLDGGLRATPEMRRQSFTFRERAVLIPVACLPALKWSAFLLMVVLFLGRVGPGGESWHTAFRQIPVASLALGLTILAGPILTPLLLPWLPGRAFSLKGLSLGVFGAALLAVWEKSRLTMGTDHLDVMAWLLLIPAIAAFWAMDFTGSSPYTSLSGVKKEMRWALPLQIGAATVGFAMLVASRFVS